jgi:hypothetical protein
MVGESHHKVDGQKGKRGVPVLQCGNAVPNALQSFVDYANRWHLVLKPVAQQVQRDARNAMREPNTLDANDTANQSDPKPKKLLQLASVGTNAPEKKGSTSDAATPKKNQ